METKNKWKKHKCPRLGTVYARSSDEGGEWQIYRFNKGWIGGYILAHSGILESCVRGKTARAVMAELEEN